MAGSHGISAPAMARVLSSPAGLLGRVWTFFALRLAGARQDGERLLVLEDRLTIGPKKTLTLVQCAGHRYLVAASGDTIASLVEIPSREALPRARKGGGQ